MASCGYSSLHPVNEILRDVVNEAIPSDSQLIAHRAFEPIQVQDRSGTILIEESRAFMGEAGADPQRAPGAARQALSHFSRSSTTYKCEIYSFADSIPMEDIADSQYPMQEQMRSARRVKRALLLAEEKRAADVLFDTGSFANTSPGTKFDSAGGEPLTFLSEQIDVLRAANHGIMPDTMILGYDVFRALGRNPEMRGYITTGAGGVASGNRLLQNDVILEVLRDQLGIPNILVGAARRETAVAGATSNEAQIWDAETIGLYLMRGGDPQVGRSGNVKIMPLCAVDLRFQDYIAGEYDDLDMVRKNVYGEHVQQFKLIDATRGRLLTNCLA